MLVMPPLVQSDGNYYYCLELDALRTHNWFLMKYQTATVTYPLKVSVPPPISFMPSQNILTAELQAGTMVQHATVQRTAMFLMLCNRYPVVTGIQQEGLVQKSAL